MHREVGVLRWFVPALCRLTCPKTNRGSNRTRLQPKTVDGVRRACMHLAWTSAPLTLRLQEQPLQRKKRRGSGRIAASAPFKSGSTVA